MKCKDGTTLHIRQSELLNEEQKEIYNILEIKHKAGETTKIYIWCNRCGTGSFFEIVLKPTDKAFWKKMCRRWVKLQYESFCHQRKNIYWGFKSCLWKGWRINDWVKL